MKSSPRRKFLALTGLSVLGGVLGYGYLKGVRYPRFHFTPDATPTMGEDKGIRVQAQGAVFQEVAADGTFRFRAFVPEPQIEVTAPGRSRWRFILQNVHPESTLVPDPSAPSLIEHQDNLLRTVDGEAQSEAEWRFGWTFPKQDAFRFTIIGDTGGGSELDWVLKRSVSLGADFILHLGDFYYDPGDLERAAAALNKISIPTFAAIGNHDFRVGWRSIYEQFTRLIGPRNSSFRLNGIQFLNLDTANDFWPADRGERLRLLQLFPVGEPNASTRDYVVFTHRPLTDVNGLGEADWLRRQLLGRGMTKLLAGHIHIKDELDDQGLYTYISGEGLAHADLILDRPIARILVADVTPDEPVKYRWAPLKMPFELHCSSRNLGVLELLEKHDALQKLRTVCGKPAPIQ